MRGRSREADHGSVKTDLMFVVCLHVVSLSAREIVLFVEFIVASEFAWFSERVQRAKLSLSITARRLDLHEKNLMHDLSPLIEIVYLWRIACCNDQAIKRAPSRGRGTHPFFSELQRKKKQGLSGETCGCRVRLSCLFQKQRRCTSVSAWGYAHAPDWLLCANRLCLGRLNNRSASLLWEERPQTCQQH